MKNMISSISDYLLIPIMMMAASTVATVIYVNQEVQTTTYLSYAWAWSRANDDTRNLMVNAMSDEKINRWESTELIRIVLDDIHSLSTCPDEVNCSGLTKDQARTILIETMKK